MTLDALDKMIFASIWNKADQALALQREPRPPIENLVCEGGGEKAKVFIGALQVLEENGLLDKLKRVAGSSAGGIIVALLAVGYSPDELVTILSTELDINVLRDRRDKRDPTRIIEVANQLIGLKDIFSLFEHKGLYKGEKFLETFKSLIEKKLQEKLRGVLKEKHQEQIDAIVENCKRLKYSKEQTEERVNAFLDGTLKKLLDEYYIHDLGSLTFGQLKKLNENFPGLNFKDLYLTGTRLSDTSLRVFSAENDPNMPIALAVRITMSFPVAFEPVLYQGEYYADGGIALNAPISIFDEEKYLSHGRNEAGVNPCTLGLLVDSKDEINARWGLKNLTQKELSLVGFFKKVIGAAVRRADKLHEQYNINIVQIFDQNVKTLDFSVDDSRLARQILAGRQAMQNYLDLYLDEEIKYSHLPNYHNIYEKYYSKGPQELARYLEYELWPLVQEIHSLWVMWQRVDFNMLLNEAQVSLRKYDLSLVEKQRINYQRLREIEIKLENLGNQLELVQRKKRLLLARQKEFWIILDNLGPNPDPLHTSEIYGALSQLTYEISQCDDELKKKEGSKHQIANEYKELKDGVDPILFPWLRQEEVAKHYIENGLIDKLKSTEEALHEHIDVILDALRGHGRKYPDPRLITQEKEDLFHPMPAAALPDSTKYDERNIDYLYAKNLEDIIDKITSYQHKDTVIVANRRDTRYNHDQLVKKNKKHGRHESAYTLTTLVSQSSTKESYLTYQKESETPPVVAHILTPERGIIQDESQSLKELIIVFEEPSPTREYFHYVDALKYSRRREAQFAEFKEKLLKQIKWSIRQIKEQGLKPPSSKIQLTIYGKHLAGQDAQYLLAEIINELERGSNRSELNLIEKIDLVLVDPTRVSEQQARKTADKITSLKKTKPNLSIKGYNLIREKKVKQDIYKRKKYDFIGEKNILGYVEPSNASVIADLRDKKDTSLQYRYIDNATNPSLLEKELNADNLTDTNPLFRKFRQKFAKFKAIGKYIIKKAIPHTISFLANLPINPLAGISILFSPIAAIADLFKKPLKVKKIQIDWMAKLETKLKSDVPFGDTQESIWEQAHKLRQEASPEMRLQQHTKPPCENIVIAGGGYQIFGAIGALSEMKKQGTLATTKRMAGSSTGGLLAGLLAVGFQPEELFKILAEELSPKNVLAEHAQLGGLASLFERGGVEISLANLVSLFKSKALFKGERFTGIVQALIRNKLENNIKMIIFKSLSLDEIYTLQAIPPGLDPKERSRRIDAYLDGKLKELKQALQIEDFGLISFKQLQELSRQYPNLNIKELYITGTNISDSSMKVFSADGTPNMPIATAMRITLSFPGGFEPIKYEGEYYVDGAIANKYPMEIFDDPKFLSHGLNQSGANPCTLGLMVESNDDIARRWGLVTKNKKLKLSKVIESVWAGLRLRDQSLRKYDINTVQISDDVSSTYSYEGPSAFNATLTKEQRHKLLQNGEAAMRFYHTHYQQDDLSHAYQPVASNFEQKYFYKSVAELKRIMNEEIIPLIDKISSILPMLEKENMEITKLKLAKDTKGLAKEAGVIHELRRAKESLEKEKSTIIRALELNGERMDMEKAEPIKTLMPMRAKTLYKLADAPTFKSTKKWKSPKPNPRKDH